MAWKFPWTAAGPMDRRAAELADEEAELAQQAEELRRQIDVLQNPPVPEPTPAVWRDESTTYARPVREPQGDTPPLPTRTHRAQQRRDRNLFILLALALLIVIFWLIREL